LLRFGRSEGIIEEPQILGRLFDSDVTLPSLWTLAHEQHIHDCVSGPTAHHSPSLPAQPLLQLRMFSFRYGSVKCDSQIRSRKRSLLLSGPWDYAKRTSSRSQSVFRLVAEKIVNSSSGWRDAGVEGMPPCTHRHAHSNIPQPTSKVNLGRNFAQNLRKKP
jgi:hypothetical protein